MSVHGRPPLPVSRRARSWLVLLWPLALVAGGGRLTAAETVTLSILSRPEGARIEVDGKPRGHTPQTVRELPANRPISIRLELDGYEKLERSLTRGPGTVDLLEVELIPLHPGLQITTLPGAEVIVIKEDNELVRLGVTDAKGVIDSGGRISGASCTIRISKEGFQTFEQKVTLNPQTQVKLPASLVPKPGRLQIVSVPVVSEVTINGVKRALIRGVVEVEPEVELKVELKPEGYRAVEKSIKLGKGAEQSLAFGNLEQVTAGLRISVVTPAGPAGPDFHAKARVFVDNREYPWNRGVLNQLTPKQNRSVRILHEAYEFSETELRTDITENASAELTFRAELKPALVRLITPPQTAYAVRMGDTELKVTAEEATGEYVIKVPQGTAFTLEVAAVDVLPARRDFEVIPAGEVIEWTIPFQPDVEGMARRKDEQLKERIQAEDALVLSVLGDYLDSLRSLHLPNGLSEDSHAAGLNFVRQVRSSHAIVLGRNSEAEARLKEIEVFIRANPPRGRKPPRDRL